ncbi:sigma 54-interacting transcriptional regulator [bacterium]|nr:sigma 54-interacting transcriptional regulator [bacterium]
MHLIDKCGDLPTKSRGYRYFNEHRYELAVPRLEQELTEASDTRQKSYLRYYLGKSLFIIGNYPRAKRQFLTVSKWASNSNEQNLRFRCVVNLAVLEVAQGNSEKGLRIFERFIPLYQDRLSPHLMGSLFCNAALALMNLTRLDEADQYLVQAMELATAEQDRQLELTVLYYNGILEIKRKRLMAGLKELRQALTLAKELKDEYFVARINWQMGNASLRHDKFDKALTYLMRAIRVSKKRSFRIETSKCLNDYAWCLYKQQNFTEARNYAEETVQIARETGVDMSNYLDTLDKINLHLNDNLEEEELIGEIERESAREFGIIGVSEGITGVIESIKTFASSDDPVLIYGETGTGKELVAHALFAESSLMDKAYIKRNCAAIPETLMESEFFGHVKGAFTGATANRKGIFAEADGGTLFLDEIGELPLALQAKLLRVLETGEYYCVGSTSLNRVKVRIIVATNRKLDDDIRSGKFREDLYFRLNTIKIDIPLLKDRREDITILVNHFLFLLNDRYKKYYKSFSDNALQLLERYRYPGNVRELKNIVSAAYLSSRGRLIGSADVEKFLQNNTVLPEATPHESHPVESFNAPSNAVPFEAHGDGNQPTLKEYVSQAEKSYLLEVLKRADTVNKACSILKISRPTFYQKLKLYSIKLNSRRLV